MSQQPPQQSERIRQPSYRPRTTWALPEIVSVRISALQSSVVLIFILFL
jgi:hypothetical protein